MSGKEKKATRERRPLDFQLKAIQMAEKAQDVASVATELKVPIQTLHNWISAYRKGDLGEKIKLLPDHLTYLTRLCKKRAQELKSQEGGKNTRAGQKEMQVLQELLAKFSKKKHSNTDE